MQTEITITGNAAHMYKQATIVRGILKTFDVPCEIVGGFVRDVIFGIEPKDIDIVVPSDPCGKSVVEIYGILTDCLPKGEWQMFPFYDRDIDEDRVHSVFKSTVYNVDVIVYHAESCTLAIQWFDDVINMLSLNPDNGEVTYHAQVNTVLPMQPMQPMQPSLRVANKARQEKMMDKRDNIMLTNKWYSDAGPRVFTKAFYEGFNIQRED